MKDSEMVEGEKFIPLFRVRLRPSPLPRPRPRPGPRSSSNWPLFLYGLRTDRVDFQ